MNNGIVQLHTVNNHNFVLPFWFDFKDAMLLHIDAHPDMDDHNVPTGEDDMDEKARESYADSIRESAFISAAVHHGLINDAYWYTPHVPALRFLGDKEYLATEDMGGYITWRNYIVTTGEPVDEVKTNGRPFILDIDLDAFSSAYRKVPLKQGGDTAKHWRERLNLTAKLLSTLPVPDCITIARTPRWTHRRYGKQVEAATREMLEQLY